MTKTSPENAINPVIFRAYDIRGIAGKELTESAVFLIGKALGSLVRDSGNHQVVIARDGRVSGPALSKALSDGILSVGCDVIDIGMVPTPVLYFATHILAEQSGVMVTGSHNPADYNGLKMVINGCGLSEQNIQALRERIEAGQFYVGLGVRHELDISERYISQIEQNIQLKRPLKIIIDAGNGVAGAIAPAVFRRLGCDVTEMFCDVDGRFPNHHADPSQPENLQDLIRAVKEKNADVGLAFDGDGDRLGVVTNRGEVIWPDRQLMLFAKAIIAENPGAKIIYDVKCSNHLGDMISKLGGEPIMWKTGHSHIKAKMAETGAHAAGEMSGHLFFKDRWYGFDDAIYAGARMLEILAAHEESSAEIFDAIPNSVNTPEMKIAVPDDEKFGLMQQLIDNAFFSSAKEIMTVDGLRVNFADGWGLVRPSNTSPYLVLRFEANNQKILSQIQEIFREWILSVRPSLQLPY
ncbi:MAG TPA: phosphomannomutase/phosphoglucomutase [Gammaproteobacteria bacterium]|jgi:phosphomannomutase/phosphoglucomutase|nr:phosphomannomutase/phosphoglucomutase [Gammaproteobacteria bacterium]